MKIIVKDEAEKELVKKALRHIHDLDAIDTDHPLTNLVCHWYLTADIEVEEENNA